MGFRYLCKDLRLLTARCQGGTSCVLIRSVRLSIKRVWGLGFWVWDLGFWVWGLGCRYLYKDLRLPTARYQSDTPCVVIRSVPLSIYLYLSISVLYNKSCVVIWPVPLSIYPHLSVSICVHLHLCASIVYGTGLGLGFWVCSLRFAVCGLGIYVKIFVWWQLAFRAVHRVLWSGLCLCLSICIYLCLSTSMCIYLSICVYLYLSIYLCLSTSIYLSIYLHLSICVYLCVSIYIYVRLSIYLCLSICVYLSVSIYIYVHLSGTVRVCV